MTRANEPAAACKLPMRRRLFSLASLLSLLLCVATVVFWVRSYWVIESLGYEARAGHHYGLSSSNGNLVWFQAHCRHQIERKPAGLFLESMHLGPDESYNDEWPPSYGPCFGGFCVGHWASGGLSVDENGYYDCAGIQTRYWLFAAIAAILPLVGIVRHLRTMKWRHRRQCLQCGYSLTGNTSGVCPECGTAVAGKAGT